MNEIEALPTCVLQRKLLSKVPFTPATFTCNIHIRASD